MITFVLTLLWILFLISIVVSVILMHSSSSYDFQIGEIDIPYVTMDVQGNQFNMIVDTGCGVSLLNKPAIQDCELMYQNCDRVVSLSAITDDKIESGAITVSFEVGKREVTEDFFLQDVEDFGNFQQMYGITIHGLLGSSFFEKNNCVIDYENHTFTIL